ncbi:MAG: B12-binding domain-containing radical SAM protein [Burkholderiales bacterium]|nr:B12-binding domain-containing radical SAM protein [Burkholderiales bacterium]
MHVVLCSVYHHDPHDVMSGRSTWENLAIRYVGAAIADLEGVQVSILDNHLHRRPNAAAMTRLAALPPPDVVALSALSHNMPMALDLVRRVRLVYPRAVIVMGGFGPATWHDQFLPQTPEVDAVFLGDGEQSFREFIQHLRDGEDWHATPGIAWCDAQRRITRTAQPRMAPLDELRWPLREPRYPLDECTISASRGCAYNCSFCSIAPFYAAQPGKKVRFRAPAQIVAEMAALVREQGVRWINFTDDDFLGINRIHPGWSDELAHRMIEQGLNLRFFFQTRVDHIQEPGLALLKKAGLRTVALGVESYVPRMLEVFNKRTTIESSLHAVGVLTRLNINYELYSIATDADTTLPEILFDIDRFISLRYFDSNDPVPFSMQINEFRAYAYRGTPLFNEYQRRGILHVEGFDIGYDFSDPLTAQLVRTCGEWNRRWKPLSDVILQYRYSSAIKRGELDEAVFYKRLHNRYFELDTRWTRALCESMLRHQGLEAAEYEALCVRITPALEQLAQEVRQHERSRELAVAGDYGGFAAP